VRHEGTLIPYDSDIHEGHDSVFAGTFTNPDGSIWFNWSITDNNGDFALAFGDEYSISINTGTVFPGETFARGHNLVVNRTTDSLGHHIVTFTQEVVRTADQGCDGAGVCTANAGRTNSGYLDGWVDNLQYVDDAADRAAMRGFDLASNIDWVSSPLELDYLTNSIFLRVANSHFEGPPSPALTQFVGFAEFTLPFPMLHRLYDVTSPVKVFGLAAGTRYACSVRAKSRWGYSYRAFDTMPRTP
jgi:hypothetical protein